MLIPLWPVTLRGEGSGRVESPVLDSFLLRSMIRMNSGGARCKNAN